MTLKCQSRIQRRLADAHRHRRHQPKNKIALIILTLRGEYDELVMVNSGHVYSDDLGMNLFGSFTVLI